MDKTHAGFTVVELIIVVCLVLLVGLGGFKVLKSHQADANTRYFTALTQQAKTYYHEQARVMGIRSDDHRLSKSCYRTNQTVVDEGELWCGIRVTQKISVTPDEKYLEQFQARLKATLKREGFYVSDGGVTTGAAKGISFSAGKSAGAEPKLCNVGLDYSPRSRYADARTTATYTLTCEHSSSSVVAGFEDRSKEL